MRTGDDRQRAQLRAFGASAVAGVAVWLGFWLAGRFLGPKLGPGWSDVLQGGGGVIALIVFAVAFIMAIRRGQRAPR